MSENFSPNFPNLKLQTTYPTSTILKNNLKQISSKAPHNNISHKQHQKFPTQQKTKQLQSYQNLSQSIFKIKS